MATIPELLDGHITLEVECLDRLYLNGYIGKLATGPGLMMFMRGQLGKPIPSPVVLGQVSEKFRQAVKAQAEREQIPIYQFQHKERKDDIANDFRRQRQVRDGIVFIGVAQEKAQAFHGKKVNGQFQFDRDKTVYVNHYYFYIDDADFGPLFLKICSYAPWSTKLCLNGHEWAKRQLEKKKIAYEALDNGFLSCSEAGKLQKLCDSLGPDEIDRVFRKWLQRIPLPLRAEGRGCRTEGTFRNPNDFGVNKGLSNLPYLQKIGRQINRRLLEVERVSHNSGLSGDSIQRVVQTAVTEDGQKAPGLKFGQPRVMALLLALTLFHHLIDGFRNRDLRQQVADLLGVTLAAYTPHQMTYDLRRLRLKGLIYRPPKTNRYFVTPYGWKVARMFSRLEARVLRPAMAMFTANDAVLPFPLRQALDRVDAQLDLLIYEAFPLQKVS